MKKLFLSIIIVVTAYLTASSQSVIDAELQSILNQKNNEEISINIIFKSQLNATELNERSNKYLDKDTRRLAAIEELKNFSEESQQEVLSIIKSTESKNNASKIVCHWLSNSITCTTTKEVIEQLAKRDDILMIGYNCDRNAILEDNSLQSTVYSHGRSGDAEITENVVKVNAPQVWEMGYTGKGVLVAILDTGINSDHPDLADHLWDGGAEYPNHGYNAYDGSNETTDKRGHGSHCAGIICGDGTGDKHTGIAPDVTLMCVKTLNDNGNTNANAICAGMEFAAEHGADVLSMSLGIANSSITDRTMIRQTCVNALELGIIAAVAAGNDGAELNSYPIPNNIRVPASCPAPWIHPDQQENTGGTSCVVAVGAVDKNDKVTSFSSQGPVTWQETSYADYPYEPGIGLIRPDVCAPGYEIISLSYDNDSYTKMSGTSQAAPCVAGIISLMLSKNPELTPAEISEILETTAVKLSDKKNNETGSGRVDALAAINAIDMGEITFKDITFTDENNNGKINANEEIILNICLENTSDESYNNVKAVLKCDNDLVEITNNNIEIGDIAAKQTFNIENKFSFIVDKKVENQTKLYFDLEFYKDDNKISTTRFLLTTTDKTLRFSSVIVTNDDNGNGVLEAGETADLGIVMNNSGDEIVLNLNGLLKSESEFITINNNYADFSSIAPNSSSTMYYNVTLSNNATANTDIPFELETMDKYNDINNYSFSYVNSCNVIYTLKDEFGDGWGGAKIIASYNDDSEPDTYTVSSGKSETFTKTINTGVEVSLEWKRGSNEEECKYTINYENGAEIYSGEGGQKGTFFSWINNCSTQEMRINTYETVRNLSIVKGEHSVTLKWEAPETEGVIGYEIYRETILLDTTENLSYVDDNLISGTYTYNVRPIFENCNGATVSQEVTFCESLEDSSVPNVNIYPNPSKGSFTIEHENIESITLYNITGTKILEDAVDANEYMISDLKPGIYFVNIKTDAGSVVKKIVKY